jgi:hypothetical protein
VPDELLDAEGLSHPEEVDHLFDRHFFLLHRSVDGAEQDLVRGQLLGESNTVQLYLQGFQV